MPPFLVKGRLFSFTSPPTPPPPAGDITVTVTFASVPTVANSSFATLKYDKQGVFNFELDDRSAQMRDVLAYFKGGTSPITGVTYPGLTFTDGCGNNVKWRAAIATNAHLQSNDTDWVNFNGCLSWAEMANLISNDFMIENHGYYHNEDTGAGLFTNGTNVRKNLHDNTVYIYQNLQANGINFRPRVVVVPNSDANYAIEGQHLKYLAVTSQNQIDGLTTYPDNTDQSLSIDSFDSSYKEFRRSYKDGWTATDTTNFNTIIDNNFLAGMSTSNHKMWRLFSHYFGSTAEFTAWKNMIDHLNTAATDRVWVTSLQEFMEYLETKEKVVKTEQRVGSVLTISLSLANIPEHNRYRDMTLKINSDAAISSINVSGSQDSFTSSNSAKLINIYKKKTSGFHDPSLESDLATPTLNILTTSGDRVELSWTPITNTQVYTLQRATDSLFTTNLTTVYTGNATTYLNTGLSATTTYYYRVKGSATTFFDSAYSTTASTTTGTITNLTQGGDFGIFNPALSSGNTYRIPAGTNYTYIYFSGRNGTSTRPITIINTGGVVVYSSDFKLENCSYINVTGTGSIGTTYGFKATNPTNPTVGNGIGITGLTHHCTMEYIEVDQKAYIALVKNEAIDFPCDTTYWWPARMTDITMRYIKGTNIWQDGFYMGSSDPYNEARPVLCTPTTSTTSIVTPTSHPTTVNLTVGTALSINSQTGYAAGQKVLVSNNGSNQFEGTVTSYNSSTGALVLSSTSNVGTGTFGSWQVNTKLFPRPTGLGNVVIHDCIINNLGRSAVQAGGWDTGVNLVYNNVITNCGFELNDQQGAGIAIGSACTGVTIYNNTIDYTYKMPIYSYHYGDITIHDNTANHTGKVIVSGVEHTNPDVPSLFFNTFNVENPSATSFNIFSNTFGSNTSTGGYAIQFYTGNSIYDYASTGNLICTNTFNGNPITNAVIDKSQPIANGNTVNYSLVCP